MSEPKAPPGRAGAPATGENQAIREPVRELTSEVLQRRRLDTEQLNSFAPEAERYAGGLAHRGKGEILILDNTLTGTDS